MENVNVKQDMKEMVYSVSQNVKETKLWLMEFVQDVL